jgi:hypothetical protein
MPRTYPTGRQEDRDVEDWEANQRSLTVWQSLFDRTTKVSPSLSSVLGKSGTRKH